MKRITTTFVLMLMLTGYAGAQQQITNAGFESWDTLGDYTQPANWFTLNPLTTFGYDPSTTITADAHSGNFAVQLQSLSGQFSDISGVLCTGPILNANMQPDFSNMKVAFTSKPLALEVYYKAFPKPGDTCVLAMYLTHWNMALQRTDTVARAGFEIKDSVGVYTLGSCAFEYFSPVQPDSMFVIASSSSDGYHPTVGSKLILDDLHLTYPPTGLSEIKTLQVAVYPNPAASQLMVQSEEPIKGTLKLFSMNGALVHTQDIDNKYAVVDVATLSNGIYLMVLQSEQGMQSSRKISVQH